MEEWANRKKENWLFSETGELIHAERFINAAGFTGIMLQRNLENESEMIIGLDLSNNLWKGRFSTSDHMSAHGILLATLALRSSKQDMQATAWAIAQSFNHQEIPFLELEGFNEILPANPITTPILERDFTSGGLSFSVTPNSIVEVNENFTADEQTSQGSFSITNNPDEDFTFHSRLLIKKETGFENLDDWGENVENSWNASDESEVLFAQKTTTRFGYQTIAILREKKLFDGSMLYEYKIAVDLTNEQWRQHHPSGWLLALVTGHGDSEAGSSHALGLGIARSLYLGKEELEDLPAIEEIVPENRFDVYRYSDSFKDGPILFFRKSDLLVEIKDCYFEGTENILSGYSIINPDTDSPISLSIERKSAYKDLEHWASTINHSWNVSENTSSLQTEKFETDDGLSGIAILRKTSMGETSYEIGVDLTNEAWKQRIGNESQEWLFAHFSGSKEQSGDQNFVVARSIAESIRYLDDEYHGLSEFFTNVSMTASASTGFPVSVEGYNWFTSPWFGAFHDSSRNWIYHFWLGWVYSHPSTDNTSHWFWTERSGWLWTNRDAYPYLYCKDLEDWIYLKFSGNHEVNCFDYHRQSWKQWTEFVSIEPIDLSKLSPEELTAYKINKIKESDLSTEEKVNEVAKVILFGL